MSDLISDMLHMIAGVILFLIAITAINMYGKEVVKSAFITSDLNRVNTTIVESKEDGDNGISGVEYTYQLTGTTVIEEILEIAANNLKSGSSEVAITYNGTLLTASGYRYNNHQFLEYCLKYSKKPINNLILSSNEYYRTYGYDTDGNVISVTYTPR